MTVRGRRSLLVAVLALSVVAAGCAGPSGESTQEPVTEATIEATEWRLTPANITVPAGEEVTITVENVGNNQHNVGVDLDGDGETEDDVRTETIAQGETDQVSFTVAEPGEYAFYCDLPGHRGQGMEGTLTVE